MTRALETECRSLARRARQAARVLATAPGAAKGCAHHPGGTR